MNYNIDEDVKAKIDSEVEKQAKSDAPEINVVNYDNDHGSLLSEEKLRVNILNESIESAKKIYETNQKHEKEKAIWRRFFICLLSGLLLASLIFGGILIYNERISDFQLSILAGSILAEIFSMLFFMIKYVHTDLYLETFKTVTQNLLDYLIQDKGGKGD